MVATTKLLSLVFQDYAIEPDSSGRYVQDLGRTPLQILYDDSQNLVLNPNSPTVLSPRLTRRLWVPFESGQDIDTNQFYNEELHRSSGAEVGDLLPMVTQLGQEMYDNFLYVNSMFVVANEQGMVLGLGNGRLPAFIQPVGIYTAKPLDPKDKQHGMALREFQDAGGRIVAHGRLSAEQYQLKHCEGVRLSQSIEPLGAKEGDEIYANLDAEHSVGVKAVGWLLCRSDEWPSDLDADYGLDGWFPGRGVLRGRRLNAAISDQERMQVRLDAALRLEQYAKELREGTY